MKTAGEPKVQGILLAGLNGWSESGIESFCCRPLLPVAGRPLIEYGFNWLRLAGVEHVSVCADGYLGAFRRVFSSQPAPGVTVTYHEDLVPRGTAGCVLDAASDTRADVLLVAESALAPWLDPLPLLEAHLESGAGLTVVGAPAGLFEEPAQAFLEPLGGYVISRQVLEHVPSKGFFDIKEMWIPRLHEQGVLVRPYVAQRPECPRVTDAASYLAVNEAVLARMSGIRTADFEYRRVGEAWVHVTARIDPTARLSGPVLIGPRCSVGARVNILGPTTMGPDCQIESDVNVLHSSLWTGCRIGAGAVVIRSIVTAWSSIEAGGRMRNSVWGSDPNRSWQASLQARLYWPVPTALPADELVQTVAVGAGEETEEESVLHAEVMANGSAHRRRRAAAALLQM